jgi:hypothetical protein
VRRVKFEPNFFVEMYNNKILQKEIVGSDTRRDARTSLNRNISPCNLGTHRGWWRQVCFGGLA